MMVGCAASSGERSGGRGTGSWGPGKSSHPEKAVRDSLVRFSGKEEGMVARAIVKPWPVPMLRSLACKRRVFNKFVPVTVA
jgi:hypothetical protein